MKSIFKLFTTTLVVCSLAISTQVYAKENTGKALQDYVNQLQTFKADFVQTQPDEELFETNQSTGHFELTRPGKLTWEYFQPEQQKIVVDGRNLWVYDQDLDQVTVRPINDIKAEIPLSWLLYNDPIQDKFTIIESGDKSSMQWFNLTPKAPTYFQSMDVGMKDGEMVEVKMYQSPTNVTNVTFKNIQSNQVIPYQNYEFKVPEGADLVGTPQ